jgi:PAS domain S-box-containing protein
MLGEELNLQEHRLKLATQIAGVGIWERDMVTGAIVWEAQMYRLRGLQPDDPRTPREIDEGIVAPLALQERWQRIERHLVDSEPYEYEFEVRWPDGSMHWLVSTGRAVRDASGKAVRMVGLNWDITQRKRAEAAQRDAEAADRASRAKSEFLARMSHELRTPLNAMLGFAQLLEHDGGARLDALQRERLARIRSAGTHLLSLIDEVLDLSAVEAGSLPVALQPIALDEAIEEVRQWLAPLADDGGLTLQVVSSGAWVHADARRLRQVLANLMSNAIKYNRRGGQVSLAARRLVVDGAPGWELCVRDTGRGLSAEQQAHLYEPFNRLGAERDGIEGRGIGLMTVHHLVRLMGGRLQVNSRLGEGSEFRVWLTLAAALAESPPPQQDDVASAGATKQMSVLYVEDNAVNVLVMRELLALRPNITLHVAVDGHGGIEAALQHRPDLVLVDMQLPDMDGHELLRRLRVLQLPAALIALSANAMPDAVAQARAAGFDDYWTKPIDVPRLLASLDRLAAASRRDTTSSPILAKD